MRLSVPDIDYTLTGKMFRYIVLSFFVSNIMTVLGTMIDSFIASNAMDEATAAAIGFVSPAVILFSLIGTTAAVGFQVTCIRSLSRGDREGAGKALGEALILGLGLSVRDICGCFDRKHYSGPDPAGICTYNKPDEWLQKSSVDVP